MSLIVDLLWQHLYSWSPYKVQTFSEKNGEVHGMERRYVATHTLSTATRAIIIIKLKAQVKRLEFYRRPSTYTPDTIVSTCIQVR